MRKSELFILYIISRGISALGTQASFIAANYWFVYQIDSGILMGLGNSLPALVIIMIAPWGGIIADQNHNNRLNQLNSLFRYDMGNFLITLAIFFLLFFHQNQSMAIIVLFIVLRCCVVAITALSHPSESSVKQAFEYTISGNGNRIEQMNAIYFTILMICGVLGQLISVLFATRYSYLLLFFIDSISFLLAAISIITLFFMLQKIFGKANVNSCENRGSKSINMNFLASFATIMKQPFLKKIFFMMLFINFGFSATPIILGFYVKRELALNPVWFGYFMVAFQIGGTLITGIRSFYRFKTRRPIYKLNLYLLGLTVICFLFYLKSNTYILLSLSFITGIMAALITILIETIIDEHSPLELRGRIESYFWITNNIMKPISMGFSGLLIDVAKVDVSIIFLVIGFFYLATLFYGTGKKMKTPVQETIL